MTTNLNILLNGCRRNDVQSQQQLYRICYPEMIKICYRYAPDADGAGTIFNDAMLRVFKNISTYTDEGKLMGWIKTIVINCSIDFCKKRNV
ncbi:MAG: sigma-70 family RNA polymerase sigma factor, partial [Ferruginibacter sp.]